jgi:hypothetical protein
LEARCHVRNPDDHHLAWKASLLRWIGKDHRKEDMDADLSGLLVSSSMVMERVNDAGTTWLRLLSLFIPKSLIYHYSFKSQSFRTLCRHNI